MAAGFQTPRVVGLTNELRASRCGAARRLPHAYATPGPGVVLVFSARSGRLMPLTLRTVAGAGDLRSTWRLPPMVMVTTGKW